MGNSQDRRTGFKFGGKKHKTISYNPHHGGNMLKDLLYEKVVAE
jgi:hypothetical protein